VTFNVLKLGRALVTAAVLLSPLAVSAAALAQAAGGELRVATPFSDNSVHPRAAWLMHGHGIGEQLMRFEEDGQFHPFLLEALDSLDPRTWKLTLRPGLTFQNGKPVTAEAVVAAIEYQRANSAGSRGAVPADSTFTATGPLEITFKTTEPFGSLPGVLAHRLMFPIFDAETVIAADASGADLVGAGIWTGPYAVTALNDEKMTAVRYDGYWQGTPAMASLTLSFVPDTNAAMLAVQNGELDIALWMPGTIKPLVDASPNANYTTTSGTDSYMTYLNVTKPPFDDVRVRKAFMKGIDYKELADGALGGMAKPATSFYAPFFRFAVHNQATDKVEAARLLDEAGWLSGADGIRVKDGKPLHVDVIQNTGIGDLVPLSTAVQYQLRGLGFDLSMVPVEDGYAGYTTFEWNAGFNSDGTWGSGIPENFLFRYLTEAGDRNFTGYHNPEIAQITADLPKAVDPDARNALLARVQQIMIEEDPAIFLLAFYDQGAVVSDAYSNYHPGFALAFIDWQTAPNS
jgi:peptide/nickel transport system substrate-binding protein